VNKTQAIKTIFLCMGITFLVAAFAELNYLNETYGDRFHEVSSVDIQLWKIASPGIYQDFQYFLEHSYRAIAEAAVGMLFLVLMVLVSVKQSRILEVKP